MEVRTTEGSPGQVVTVQIWLDSEGTTVALIQVNLAFDEAVLTSPVGAMSTPPPEGWDFFPDSPITGVLRFLLLDLDGVGQTFNGPIFEATFTIDPGAAPEIVPVTAVAGALDDAGGTLNIMVNDGAVTVN